jgi:PEP-CTERM motif
MKITVPALALAGACLLSTAAFASTTVLGNLDPNDSAGFSDLNATGVFADAATFDLTVSADTAVSATIAVTNRFQFTPGTLRLFSGSPFSGTLLDSAALTFGGSAYTASFTDPLGPGIYYAEITGRVNARLLGVGGTVTTTTAIPEPSTWAMMLLGFAGLGYAGFRKARSVRSIA